MIYLLLALAVAVVLVVFLYNGLVTLKNKCNEAWADIDTQLKRRYDLIPNLVETVKGYAKHESATLEKVTQARTAAMNAQTVQQKEQAEDMLSGALKSIFALSERYPDLKANQNFLDLQQTLKEVEEHIQMSRRYYNATVRDFNTKIEIFPNNFIAKPLGFTAREFFQATDEEKQNVKVSFADKGQTPPPTGAPAAPQSPQTPAPQAPKAPETPKSEMESTQAPAPEAPKTPETPAKTPEASTGPAPEAPAKETPPAPTTENPATPPAPEAPKAPEAPATPAPAAPEAPKTPEAPQAPTQESEEDKTA